LRDHLSILLWKKLLPPSQTKAKVRHGVLLVLVDHQMMMTMMVATVTGRIVPLNARTPLGLVPPLSLGYHRYP
jgi:hypothetical protein